jgi:hypothetical protein
VTDHDQNMRDDAANERMLNEVRMRLIETGMDSFAVSAIVDSIVPRAQDAIRQVIADADSAAQIRTVLDIITFLDGLEPYENAAYYAQRVAGKYAIKSEG